MIVPHEAGKHAGDVAASGTGLFVVLSHWAELATPIITFLVGLVTLAWWSMRLFEKYRTRGQGGGDAEA